jgi:hypothetical protein
MDVSSEKKEAREVSDKLDKLIHIFLATSSDVKWITLDVAQLILGTTDKNKRYIRRLIQENKIVAKLVDKRYFVLKQSLFDFIESN